MKTNLAPWKTNLEPWKTNFGRGRGANRHFSLLTGGSNRSFRCLDGSHNSAKFSWAFVPFLDLLGSLIWVVIRTYLTIFLQPQAKFPWMNSFILYLRIYLTLLLPHRIICKRESVNEIKLRTIFSTKVSQSFNSSSENQNKFYWASYFIPFHQPFLCCFILCLVFVWKQSKSDRNDRSFSSTLSKPARQKANWVLSLAAKKYFPFANFVLDLTKTFEKSLSLLEKCLEMRLPSLLNISFWLAGPILGQLSTTCLGAWWPAPSAGRGLVPRLISLPSPSLPPNCSTSHPNENVQQGVGW